MDDITIDARKQELLEARFMGSSKGHSGSESNMSTGSSLGAGAISDRENDSISGYSSTNEQSDKRDASSRTSRKRKADGHDRHQKKQNSAAANTKKISEYFGTTVSPAKLHQQQNEKAGMQYTSAIRSSPSSRHSSSSMSHIDRSGLVYLQKKQQVKQETHASQTDLTSNDILQLQRTTQLQQTEKQQKLEELIRHNMELEYQLKESRSSELQNDTRLTKCLNVVKELLIDKSKSDKVASRRKAMEGRLRLGQFSRQGYGYQETWTNGWAFKDLENKKHKINKEREDIEKAKKMLNKRKPTSSRTKANQQSHHADDPSKPAKEPKEIYSPQEYHERDEVLRQRTAALKRDENELQYELERLERERSLHIRELKRILNEDNSKFNNNLTLKADGRDRYLLLTMLGKGGFSEVYKGFDLDEQRFVAVKIHHLNRDWNEQKKLDYARHANRESEIHRRVNHPRIVSLYDRFEVDINTFCTVMEYCGGNDLDFYLKQHKQMSEKEARTIIMQVVSALVYLNSLERPVIHYDLKPGNILLCNGTVCGNIKITDFGLSKQLDEGLSPNDGMDLTSQGAGTYWYLPPECFLRMPGGQPPKIDNKVDVWSVGVIFFQCLYGKKPFGHNLTQEMILKQNTILKATDVVFPNKPTVSADAKSFIRSCLMYHKEKRADVFQLANHNYLKPASLKNNAASQNGQTSSNHHVQNF